MQQTRKPKRVPDLRASGRFSKAKKTLMLLTMVAPGAIWLLLLRYLPMGGIILAFKNYKIYPKDPTFLNNLIHSKWVGLDNFKFLFTTGDSWVMIRNTLAYNIVFIILGVIIPVAFAIMMSELSKKFVAKTYQTLMFFPYFLSWVVVSYFLNAFIDAQYGLIPMAQRAAGETAVSWYTTPGPWPYIIVFANLWKNVGYSTVLYLAAITGIDQTQYEAAAIDGASKWQQILHVTLPNLRTMIAILFILNVGKIFNADFGLFWNVPMQNGALFSVTQVIDTYIYRVLMNTGNIGQSTAAGLLQNIVGFICIIGANAVVKKIDSDSTLF
jgi:putative aldouronate transport system permease protein